MLVLLISLFHQDNATIPLDFFALTSASTSKYKYYFDPSEALRDDLLSAVFLLSDVPELLSCFCI